MIVGLGVGLLLELSVVWVSFVWSLNLADCPELARTKILADLNLTVWYGIVIRIYVCKILYWRILIRRL